MNEVVESAECLSREQVLAGLQTIYPHENLTLEDLNCMESAERDPETGSIRVQLTGTTRLGNGIIGQYQQRPRLCVLLAKSKYPKSMAEPVHGDITTFVEIFELPGKEGTVEVSIAGREITLEKVLDCLLG
jgi:hypothetical protein